MGDIDNYRWVDRIPLRDKMLTPRVIQDLGHYLIGLRAVNVSWDSGLLVLDSEVSAGCVFEQRCPGWTFEQGRAISPIIDQSTLASWPFSGQYDEWYFFSRLPTNLQLSSFCNWDVSISEWPSIASLNSHAMDLRQQLHDAQPLIIVGEGTRLFALSTNHEFINDICRITEEA